MGYSSPAADPAFAFDELHQIPLHTTLQPIQVLLDGSTALGVPATPPSFAVLANLLRLHSVPSSRVLVSKMNETGPNANPWVTPQAIVLQMDSVLLITNSELWHAFSS